MHLWTRRPSQKQAHSRTWDSPTLWNWPWTSFPQCSRKCYWVTRSPPTGTKGCTRLHNCHPLFTCLNATISIIIAVLSVGIIPMNSRFDTCRVVSICIHLTCFHNHVEIMTITIVIRSSPTLQRRSTRVSRCQLGRC